MAGTLRLGESSEKALKAESYAQQVLERARAKAPEDLVVGAMPVEVYGDFSVRGQVSAVTGFEADQLKQISVEVRWSDKVLRRSIRVCGLEIMISAALFSLLLVVLSGSFVTIRKVSLARTRRLESRLPLLQANEKLSADLAASGADGVVVAPDLISICAKNGVTPEGKVDWSAGLTLWFWNASGRALQVYRLTMDEARTAGFKGDGVEPLCPKEADLRVYLAGASPGAVYPLQDFRLLLTPEGQVE